MGKINLCHGKYRELRHFAKTQGILFAQVEKFLYSIRYCAIRHQSFSKIVYDIVSIKVTNHVNWHRKNLQSDIEITGNLKILFEWGP